MAAATALFRLCARLGHARLALLAVPAALAVLVVRRHRPWAMGRVQATHAVLVLAVVMACVPFALIPMYYRNLDWLPGGDFTWAPMPDAVLHLALAQELTVTVPAEVPFLPGRPLRYHDGMDALAAALAREASLAVSDLTVRLVPTFLMGLLVLGAFCLGRAWVGSAGAGLVLALLVVFGEDLAWVAGAARGAPEPWAIHFLGMPTVVSLYGLNPLLPGTALLLLWLLSLLRYGEEGGRAWLWRTGALLAGVADYKVFAAAQGLAALAVAAAAYAWWLRDRRPLAALALGAALSVPLLAAAAGGTSALVRFDLWPYVPAALVRGGLWETWLGRRTDALLGQGVRTPGTLLAYFGVAVPLYLLAAFGARVVGLPALLRALRPRAGQAARLAAAAFVLMGPPLALLLAITPATYEPRQRYNEAAWFLVQAKLVAWLFAVEQLWRLARGRARVLVPAVAAVAAVSVPSTVQYLHYQLSVPQLRLLGPAETGLLGFVDQSAPGAVALARPEIATALLALTRCRAPVFTVHPYYFVTSDELQAHLLRTAEFWEAWRGGIVRGDVAAAYGASLVVADLQRDGKAPAAAGLRALYDNGRYAVYALPGGGGAAAGIMRP